MLTRPSDVGEHEPSSRSYYKDLDVQDVDATSSVLLSAARHMSEYCDLTNAKFMRCRRDKGDPALCLEEGKEVTKCALEFLKVIRATCNVEFSDHWNCIDVYNQDFKYCTEHEKKFDRCVFNKLGLGARSPVFGEESLASKEAREAAAAQKSTA